MTYCGTLAEPITKRVAEGKTHDEIAKHFCTSVKDPRQKLIRIIKELLGEEYLIEHAETLKYDVEKAKLGKITKSIRKIETATDSESSVCSSKLPKSPIKTPETSKELSKHDNELDDVLLSLIEKFGFEAVFDKLEELKHEGE